MSQVVTDVTDVLEYRKSKAEAKSERKKVLEQMAADEVAKTNLVKKTLAAQRARYGAGGMSGRGMTEGAVLKRLQEEVEEPFKEKRQSNMDKLKKIKASKPNLLKKMLSRFDDIVG
ncbi:MAG: hypothetical protein K2L95_04020 [Alphaproteobacteria bacterium]|nr:hypothetical protein [Alphaproteobacteria bacterium]MDE6571350.1 hypothetical protein [Alphaproteobacteria bacterium]